MKIKKISYTFVCVIMIIMGFGAIKIRENSFFDLEQVLFRDGYIPLGDNTYTKENIKLTFDYHTGIIKKNDFSFDIKENFEFREGKPYLVKAKIAQVINKSIARKKGNIILTAISYKGYSWKKLSKELERKGIAVPQIGSYDGLVENYNQGNRVFEMRLNSNDSSLSVERFLGLMVINKDMFLVVDTKSPEYSHEKFEILKGKAALLDVETLDRILLITSKKQQ